MDLLIGHSGFVGSNLKSQRDFDALARSTDIDTYRDKSCDLIVNCGVSAVKWMANKEPEADRAGIERLTDVLRTMRAERVVHISTIDVYAGPDGQTEDDLPLRDGLHPYGLHRLELEDFMRTQFDKVHVVRLPALFGPHLKKNLIFDLMNDNMIDKIAPNGVLQWYPITRLWSDVEKIIAADLPLAHLMPAPVSTAAIVEQFFPGAVIGAPANPAPHYDLHTRHAPVFGGSAPYIMDQAQVMDALATYIQKGN